MLIIIGLIVVFGAMLGGFMMVGGNPLSLLHANEFVVIFGIAGGTILIANPMYLVTRVFASFGLMLKGSSAKKDNYLEMMQMVYEIFQYAKREGLIALEPHIESPETSSILSKYQSFIDNHHAVEFFCDTLKVILSGGIPAHDLEDLMDMDLEGHHEEEHLVVKALHTVSDALPGIGIIAAVLGIIITMGAINEGAEAIGHKVASALVGTFMGILFSYGVLGPMVNSLETINSTNGKYLLALKAALLSFAKGAPAPVAVEFARRAIDPYHRPTFAESEEAVKSAGK